MTTAWWRTSRNAKSPNRRSTNKSNGASAAAAQRRIEGGLAGGARSWDVPRDSFFQNNFFLLPALLETVRERVRDSRVRNLVDAYCGVGFFAVELADR